MCTCTSAGLQCHNQPCSFSQICRPSNIQFSCQTVQRGTCTISGDPHYYTFDNTVFHFQGTCTYVLSEQCGRGLPYYRVEGKNEHRGSTRVSWTRLVKVFVYNETIELVKGRRGEAKVNGNFAAAPFSLNNGTVQVYESGFSVIVSTDFGLVVSYDVNHYVRISVPYTYQNETCGLCGNFNNDRRDDFRTRQGEVVSSDVVFANSWQASGDDEPGCEAPCGGLDCAVCTEAQNALYSNTAHCGILQSSSGPFAACHQRLPPQPFVESCVYDLCVGGGYQPILCQALNVYASQCQQNGIQLPSWRRQGFCEIPCPANSHFVSNGTGCPPTCVNPNSTHNCPLPAQESCICDSGYILSGGVCVPHAECGCSFEGRYYRSGETVILDQDSEKVPSGQQGFARVLKFEAEGTHVSIEMARSSRVQIDGQIIRLPFSSSTNRIRIYHSSIHSIILRTSFGVTVQTVWPHFVRVTAPGIYNGSLGGLCGDYNSQPRDDFRTPNGILVNSSQSKPALQTAIMNSVDQLVHLPVPAFPSPSPVTLYARRVANVMMVLSSMAISVYHQQTVDAITKDAIGKVVNSSGMESCRVVEGEFGCHPTPHGICSASGDPHYLTFDGKAYDFQGTCRYVLATLCNTTDGLHQFSVEAKNEPWNGLPVSITAEVYVNVWGYRVHISRDRNGVVEFGTAWKVAGNYTCSDGCGSSCPQCPNELPARAQCDVIQAPDGPLSFCHEQVDPRPFFTDCVFDVCVSGNEGQDLLCRAIQAYVSACQSANVRIYPWRQNTTCRLDCPANSHYELCGTDCGHTCASSIDSTCEQVCSEGCFCDEGFVRSGTRCIPVESCGCQYDGFYYEVNDTEVSLPTTAGTLARVLRQGSYIVVDATDLIVQFDGQSTLLVRIGQHCENRVTGMCGNFNSDPADDKVLPNDSSITCISSSGTMSLSRCQLFEAGFHCSALHLREHSCNGTVQDGRLVFHFNNDDQLCGTVLRSNGTHFIYENTIQGDVDPHEGLISREKSIHLHFTCEYPLAQALSMDVGINPVESIVNKRLPSGQGRYHLRMIPYEDAGFRIPLTRSRNLEMEIDQRLYIGVQTEGVDGRQISTILDSCWATPFNDASYPVRWDLITTECPNPADGTVELVQNGISTVARFSFRMFTFTNFSSIYLHCQVHLCLLTHNNCTAHCYPGYHTRVVRDTSHHDTAAISLGPLLLKPDERMKQSSAAVHLISLVTLLLSLLIAKTLT
eukprot:superscaffoldBa00000335_g3888